MALAQSQFEKFHTTILFGYDSSEDLRTRRDTLLADLKENISEESPSYTTFTQGSYALNTGIHPLNGNPDMDIGVLFDCAPDDYPDPLTLKKFVRDALSRTNRTVDIRRPCVTVTYKKDGEAFQHIDLAVYSKNSVNETQIAWCRELTPSADREWKPSEAQALTNKITGKFSGSDRDQFRRCVRALKRWRDEKIGHKNAPSIGLTVAAYNWFSPRSNSLTGSSTDLVALIDLVSMVLANWGGTRLTVNLPVSPYSDLFEKMTDTQMSDLKARFETLLSALKEAEVHPDTHEACKILQGQFGKDFPVPEKSETTKKSSSGVGTSGRSA